MAVTHECDHPAAELKHVARITSNLLPPELRRSDQIDAAVRSVAASGHALYALDESEMARLEPVCRAVCRNVRRSMRPSP